MTVSSCGVVAALLSLAQTAPGTVINSADNHHPTHGKLQTNIEPQHLTYLIGGRAYNR
jgi:hypothetical protein